jgi:uncharacterized membrane protein
MFQPPTVYLKVRHISKDTIPVEEEELEEEDENDLIVDEEIVDDIVDSTFDILDTPSYAKFNLIPREFRFMQHIISRVHGSLMIGKFILFSNQIGKSENGIYTICIFDKYNASLLEVRIDNVNGQTFRLLSVDFIGNMKISVN